MTSINHNLKNGCQVHNSFGQLNLTFRNSPLCWGNQVADNLDMILDLVNSGMMRARVQRRLRELDQFEHWKHTWFVESLEVVEVEGLGRCLQWPDTRSEEGRQGKVNVFAPIDQELPGIFSVTLWVSKKE